MTQNRLTSLAEAASNTMAGFALSLILHKIAVAPAWVFYVEAMGGEYTDWIFTLAVTIFYNIITILRNLAIRLAWNKGEQTRRESFAEACFNSAVAVVVSLVAFRAVAEAQALHVAAGGDPLAWTPAFLITTYMTLVSVARNYYVRRLWVWWGKRRNG